MSSPLPGHGREWQVVLEIIEEPCGDRRAGLKPYEREQFRQNVVGNLAREFAGRLKIVYHEAPAGEVIVPRMQLDGEQIGGSRSLRGSYLTWALLRLQIAARVGRLASQDAFVREAEDDLKRFGLKSVSWADGLLEWILRPENRPGAPGGRHT